MHVASEVSAPDSQLRSILALKAPSPSGHYSHAVVANGFVFVSGQLPLDPLARAIPEGAKAQARQALSNVSAILAASGSSFDRVVSATVFVSDIKYWPEIDAVWSETFVNFQPARTVAVSPELHFGCLVEIQITAVVG